MSSSSSSGSATNIEISDIFIKSPKMMTSIKLSIGSTFELKAKARSKEATLTLAPDRPNLPSSTPLIVKVTQEGFLKKSTQITIEHQNLLSNAGAVEADTSKREYRTIVKGFEIVIGFITPQTSSEVHDDVDLRPTTDGIFERCPRFRVLVIGRTGVGKTSLIRNTFGIKEAFVSHGEVGECDINKELFSDVENKRFVLHDSKGFEPGDEDNFDTVMKFLNDREAKEDIKDQVHAVWLCFSIPVNGERLFETGAERFLRLLSDGQLGKMPIIAIFTKYDALVDHIFHHSSKSTELDEKVEAEARAKLNELCIKPFTQKIGKKTNIPSIPVSTEKNYERTLLELTKLTTERVGEYLTEDVAVLSGVAQQVNLEVKLDTVIAVGKKRYWTILASTIKFPGNKPDVVLQNIHQDIVSIFNLRDHAKLLDSEIFKGLVVDIVSKPEDVLSLKQMATSLSMLGALAAIVSALSGPAAPIVLPIAATLVAGHWTILLLKQANIVLQRLMTYIVALTLIMQIIFVLTTTTENVVSRRLIKLAVKTFIHSPELEQIHSAIKQHLLGHPVPPLSRNAALQCITDLIESKRMLPADIAKIKIEMERVDTRVDEPWY